MSNTVSFRKVAMSNLRNITKLANESNLRLLAHVRDGCVI